MDPEYVMIGFGVFATLALALLVYAQRSHNAEMIAILEPFAAGLEKAYSRLDDYLVKYGDRLRPVNDAIVAIESTLDEPDDFLARLLPDAIEASIIEVLKRLDRLTDGEQIIVEVPVVDNAPSGDGMPSKE